MATFWRKIKSRPVLRTLYGLPLEIKGAFSLIKLKPQNFIIFLDIIACRFIGVGLIKSNERIRSIFCKSNFIVNYTRNRSDIFTMSEIFYRNVYRLPENIKPNVIVDLGANIGLSSVYFFEKYRPSRMICDEPNPRNVRILKSNIQSNAIPAIVLEGVIAEESGTKNFDVGDVNEANGGHIGDGAAVRAFAMNDVMALTPNNFADVVKIDIEGYEERLLKHNNNWLDRVGCIMIEFHTHCGDIIVDKPSLEALLRGKGFHYIPKGENGVEHTFIREGYPLPAADMAAASVPAFGRAQMAGI